MCLVSPFDSQAWKYQGRTGGWTDGSKLKFSKVIQNTLIFQIHKETNKIHVRNRTINKKKNAQPLQPSTYEQLLWKGKGNSYESFDHMKQRENCSSDPVNTDHLSKTQSEREREKEEERESQPSCRCSSLVASFTWIYMLGQTPFLHERNHLTAVAAIPFGRCP